MSFKCPIALTPEFRLPVSSLGILPMLSLSRSFFSVPTLRYSFPNVEVASPRPAKQNKHTRRVILMIQAPFMVAALTASYLPFLASFLKVPLRVAHRQRRRVNSEQLLAPAKRLQRVFCARPLVWLLGAQLLLLLSMRFAPLLPLAQHNSQRLPWGVWVLRGVRRGEHHGAEQQSS